MCESEKLIETVRQYPILYDLSHPDYKNIKKKDKMWDSIAKDSGGTGEELKKKWKNLRDSYSKYLRAEKPHTGQEKKFLDRYKTWPWANRMDFMRPFIQFSKTASNGACQPICDQQDDTNETNEDEIKDKEPDKIVHQQHQDQRKKNPASRPVQEKTPTASRKRKLEETESVNTTFVGDVRSVSTTTQQGFNYLQASQHNINSDHSDIDLIFMGYAKTVEKFSPRRQAMVKFKFSQILLEEELAQQAENDENRHGETSAPEYDGPGFAAPLASLLECTPSLSEPQPHQDSNTTNTRPNSPY